MFGEGTVVVGLVIFGENRCVDLVVTEGNLEKDQVITGSESSGELSEPEKDDMSTVSE